MLHWSLMSHIGIWNKRKDVSISLPLILGKDLCICAESDRRIPKGCGSCRATSEADLEMAVGDLSWPYSVRTSWASQASICVSVCLNLVWDFHHSALTSSCCYQNAPLPPDNEYNPSTSQSIPHSLYGFLSVSLMVTDGGQHTQAVNCPDHFVTRCLCPQPIAVRVIVLQWQESIRSWRLDRWVRSSATGHYYLSRSGSCFQWKSCKNNALYTTCSASNAWQAQLETSWGTQRSI